MGGKGWPACAERFGAEHRLLIAEASRDRLLAAERDLRERGHDAVGVLSDVTDRAAVAALAATVADAGGLDVLVHAAGVSPSMAEAWRILDVNLFGTLVVLETLVQLARPGAVAVCIASIAGWRDGARSHDALLASPYAEDFRARLRAETGIETSALQAYSLSKRGVILAVERRAHDWATRGARIVSLSPGLIIDTPMGALEAPGGAARLADVAALGRAGTAEEIAAACAILVSPDASYITGCDLRVDGGTLAGCASTADRDAA